MNTKKQLQKIYDQIMSGLNIRHNFSETDYNTYIVIGFLPGFPDERRIGRVVQVRKESGAWGSDQVFLREYDGNLQVHENQWFHKVPQYFTHQLDALFKQSNDKITDTYNIMGKYNEVGFIIPSKIPSGETTPLREVKKQIINIIKKNISQQ